MKKSELLKYIDNELLEKLFGFCYARTSSSYEAQELCSDITFSLVKAANSDGNIDEVYPFIWRIARNVYADFSAKKKRRRDVFYEGDADEVFRHIAEKPSSDDDSEDILVAVYRRIAFLTRAYRDVMIMYYIDDLPTSEIALRQGASENAIRQRLFSARAKIRNEVNDMNESCSRPVSLDKIEYVIIGSGNPGWGQPYNVCFRQMSKKIVWLCLKKPMSATEIAKELNIPTIFVEEELEILAAGENGEYGLLRKLDNGKYGINIILLDKDDIEKAQEIFCEQISNIRNTVEEFTKEHKEEYLSVPYLNKKVDFNLIMWQQIYRISELYRDEVIRIMGEKPFADIKRVDRPYSQYGYVDNGQYYGAGHDIVCAYNICGYSSVRVENIYIARIRKHFGWDTNITIDVPLQLAIRAIHGLNVNTLSEAEKEAAAIAIECGYLYRDGETLYTKILVSNMSERTLPFKISRRLSKCFEEQAEKTAEKLAALMRKTVPEYLLPEWEFFATLANLPVCDSLVEALIEDGILIPPQDGLGAEGCWMSVEG